MKIGNKKNWFYFACFVVFVAVFAVYIYTLPPGFTTKGDAAEFAVSTLINGVPHPPGYPLFIIISKLFLLIPVGSLPYRINLVSAFFGSLTIVLMALILKRITKDFLISIATALILAFYFIFWKYSIVSEVFVLNSFFAVLLFYVSLIVKKNLKLFYLFSFLAGLAFTNHQTIILIIPSLLYLILANVGKRLFSIRRFLISFLLFLAGFSPYIYVLWAARGNSLINWDRADNIPNLIHLILRLSYGWFKLAGVELPIKSQVLQFVDYFRAIYDQFLVIGVALAVVGLFFLFLRRKIIFMTTFSAFLLSGIIFILYGRAPVGDMRFVVVTERFFILPNLFFVVWIGAGLAGIMSTLRIYLKKTPKVIYFGSFFILYILMFSYPLWLLSLNFPKVNERDNLFVDNLMSDIFVDVPKNSVLLVTGDTKVAISAYLVYKNQRKDLKIVFPDDLMESRADWYVPAIKEHYPDLVVPEKNKDEEEKDYMARFIKANLEKFPVVCACGQYRERLKIPVMSRSVGLLEFFLKESPKNEQFDEIERQSDLISKKYKNLNPKKSFPIIYMEEDIYREYALPYVRLGNAYLAMKNYKETERLYKKALAIGPAYYQIHADLGKIYFETGRYDEAISEWEEFIKINPYDKGVPDLEVKIAEAKEKSEGK